MDGNSSNPKLVQTVQKNIYSYSKEIMQKIKKTNKKLNFQHFI